MTDEAQGHFLKRLQSRAIDLRADPDFAEIIKQLKNRAIRNWSGTKAADSHAREIAYHDLQAVGRLENYLRELEDGATLDTRKAEKVSRR